MIFKRLWFSNDYDFQIKMLGKWLCYTNANDFQMLMIIKCKWYSNANDIQMLMQCKCKWFSNKTPSLVQNVSNKQNVKKYQMRIIFVCVRSWAWQGVEKLNSKMASLRVLGVGVQTPWLRQCRFFIFHYAKFFQFSAGASLYIAVDFSHHNSVQIPV